MKWYKRREWDSKRDSEREKKRESEIAREREREREREKGSLCGRAQVPFSNGG